MKFSKAYSLCDYNATCCTRSVHARVKKQRNMGKRRKTEINEKHSKMNGLRGIQENHH